MVLLGEARRNVGIDVDLAEDGRPASNQHDQLRPGLQITGEIVAHRPHVGHVLVFPRSHGCAAHPLPNGDPGMLRLAPRESLEHEILAGQHVGVDGREGRPQPALPLFLDTTGTILATALAGPGVGIATGVVTSAVNTLRNPTFWPFVVVQIIVALYAWVAARAGLFRSFRTAVPAGLGLGVIASLTSTPISYLVFGCTTTGGIALTTALGKALGLPPLGACFFGSFVSDFGDKAVTFALVTSVLHGLPRRT